MKICIGQDEYELNELISEIRFDIVKLNAVIAGLQDVRDKKVAQLKVN